MDFNVKNSLKSFSLPDYKASLPLFDAIINSIHAIENRNENKNGKIRIYIEREHDLKTTGTNTELPVSSIRIEDNGCGFDSINFESFNTGYSDLKAEKGCKGIGRILWLKAFEKAHIKSIFKENEKWEQIDFDFVSKGDFITNIKRSKPHCEEHKTEVVLYKMYSNYQRRFPKNLDNLGNSILEHCLEFLLDNLHCPNIRLVDDDGTEIDLNSVYEDSIKPTERSQYFKLKGERFNIRYLHLSNPQKKKGKHRIHYCGNKREVFSENLNKYIKAIDHIKDGQASTYLIYINSSFLDKHVNPARTGFDIEEEIDEDAQITSEIITMKDVKDKLTAKLQTHFKESLLPIYNLRFDQVKVFIENEEPRYKPLLKFRPDKLKQLSLDLKGKELDLALHSIYSDFRLEIKREGNKLLKTKKKNVKDYPKYKKKYVSFLEQNNELGMSNLAEYVVHRKVVLDILQQNLDANDNEVFTLEQNIHSIFCPMGTTSDDIDFFEQQNLWIIDEKLVFHNFLASDRPMSTYRSSDIPSGKEPDLAIFNNANAYSEGGDSDLTSISSIVIIEFKRPGRDDYSDSDNPILQIENYVDQIKDGKVKKQGRMIPAKNIPIFAYVICDLVPTLEKTIRRRSLQTSSDGLGYFGHLLQNEVYIEIVSYDRLLKNAKKRNQILFKKLDLPT